MFGQIGTNLVVLIGPDSVVRTFVPNRIRFGCPKRIWFCSECRRSMFGRIGADSAPIRRQFGHIFYYRIGAEYVVRIGADSAEHQSTTFGAESDPVRSWFGRPNFGRKSELTDLFYYRISAEYVVWIGADSAEHRSTTLIRSRADPIQSRFGRPNFGRKSEPNRRRPTFHILSGYRHIWKKEFGKSGLCFPPIGEHLYECLTFDERRGSSRIPDGRPEALYLPLSPKLKGIL